MRKLLIILTTLISTITFAQKDTSNLKLDEVIIIGVRSDSKTPVTQKTITKEDIQKGYSGQDAPVLFQSTPSITLESDGAIQNGYMYYRLRGIDQTRINTTLNGIPLNEPEDQGAYFSNYTDLLNSMSSVQIQRGVGTSTNGSASYAGSVNLQSVNLLDSSYSNIQSGIGSYNSSRFSVGLNSGLKNNFAFYGRFSSTNSDGFRDHSGTSANTMFFSGGYYGKKDIIKLVAFSGHSENQMAYLASKDSILKNDFTNNPLTSGETDHFVQTFVQLQDIKTLNQNSTLTSSLYYTGLQGNYGVLGAVGLPASYNPSIVISNYQLFSDLYGVMSNYSYTKNNLRLNLGINTYYYYREHLMDSISLLPSTQSYKNRGEKEEVSAYVKISYDIKKFTLYGDLQGRAINFSYYQLSGIGDSLIKNNVNWSFLNPKFGAKYNLSNNTDFYFSIGQSHQEPTRTNDMFNGSDNIPSSLRFLPTILQNIVDYELGSNYKTNKLNIQYDLFYMNSTNEYVPIGGLSQYTALPLMQQVQTIKRMGFEFDLNYKLSKHFRYYFNTTIMKGIIDNNGVNINPVLTPKLIINHGIDCYYNRFSVGLNGRYVDQSYLDLISQNFILPSTPIQNLFLNNAFFKFKINKNFNLSFNINNIVNSKYYTSGYVQLDQPFSPQKVPYYFVNATRNYFLSINATF